MRTGRVIALALLLALTGAGAAFAVGGRVDAKAHPATTTTGTTREKDDDVEQTVTITGVLQKTSGGYTVGSEKVSFGPPWYAANSSLVHGKLGTSVTVTGEPDEDDDGVSVRTVDGVVYRAHGRPPWAGGPKRHGIGCNPKEKQSRPPKQHGPYCK